MADRGEPPEEEQAIDSDATSKKESAELEEEEDENGESTQSDVREGIEVEEALELAKKGRTDKIPQKVLEMSQELLDELGFEEVSEEEETPDETEERDVSDTDLEERLATLEEDVSELQEVSSSGEETEIKESIEEIKEKVTEQDNRLTELESEFEEYRAHAKKERERIRTHNLESFALRVIRVKDQTEKLLELGTFGEDAERRLEMLDKKLEQALERSNVERIDTDGKYDLDRHEIVGWAESEAGSKDDPGEIIQTKKAGYRLGDRVIRSAEVVAVDDT